MHTLSFTFTHGHLLNCCLSLSTSLGTTQDAGRPEMQLLLLTHKQPGWEDLSAGAEPSTEEAGKAHALQNAYRAGPKQA